MQAGEKVCPQCGTSYRPEALRCADCSVDLVDAASFSGVPQPTAVDFEGLECVRLCEPRWAELLHEALITEGLNANIAAVEDEERGLRVGVFVAQDDLDRAFEIDAQVAREHLGVGADALQEGRCGICGAELGRGDEELCASCRDELEPTESSQADLVIGADGVPRPTSGESAGGGPSSFVFLVAGALLGLAALFWMR